MIKKLYKESDNNKEIRKNYLVYEKKKDEVIKANNTNNNVYEDLTDKLKNMKGKKYARRKNFSYALDKDNNKYIDWYFDPDKKLEDEIKYLKLIEKHTGYKVYLNPKARGGNVKTPDYYIKDIKELWDVKGIDGNGKNRIDNIIHKAEKQTYNLVLRQRNTDFDIEYIKNKITEIFDNNQRIGIRQIILLDKDDNIILYYKR